MTFKELEVLASASTVINNLIKSDGVIAINPWGVHLDAETFLDTFGEYSEATYDNAIMFRIRLSKVVCGVDFYALTDREEMEALNEEK